MSDSDSASESHRASSSSSTSAEAGYYRGQCRSLLFHPLGVLLLEHYDELEENRIPKSRTPDWFSSLQEEVQLPLIQFHESNQTEVELTKALHRVLEKNLLHSHHVCQQQDLGKKIYKWGKGKDVSNHPTTAGKLDIAFCKKRTALPVGAAAAAAAAAVPQQEQQQDNFLDEDVVGILEASVDTNGGSKKLSQALMYAALVSGGQDTPPPAGSPTSRSASMVVPNNGNQSVNRTPPDVAIIGTTSRSTSVGDTKSTRPARSKRKRHFIVWTLHVHRNPCKPQGVVERKQKQEGSQEEETTKGGEQQEGKECQEESTAEGAKKGAKVKKGRIQNIKVLVYLCEVSWHPKDECPVAKYALLWREFTYFPDVVARSDSLEGVVTDGHWEKALKKASRSIARAVSMVVKLTEFIENKTAETRFPLWKLKGPNCVKVRFESDPDHHFMLKVFDNRFAPTARSPFLWCDDSVCHHNGDSDGDSDGDADADADHDSEVYDLGVEPYLFFHEGRVDGDATDTADTADSTTTSTSTSTSTAPKNDSNAPNNVPPKLFSYFRRQDQDAEAKRKVQRRIQELSEGGQGKGTSSTLLGNPNYSTKGLHELRPIKTAIPFGKGSVVVLQYNYVEGSHWPECTDTQMPVDDTSSVISCTTKYGNPRSFLPILNRLKSLHDRKLVHGDVRLYNMIFEKSEPGKEQGARAWLLDYDLGGKEGERTYPIGYMDYLRDVGERAGKAEEKLMFQHDLSDFVGVLGLFELKSTLLENMESVLVKLRQISLKKITLLEKKDKLSSMERTLFKKLLHLNNRESALLSEQQEIEASIQEIAGKLSALQSEGESILGEHSIQSLWVAPMVSLDSEGRVEYLESLKKKVQETLVAWKGNRLKAAKNPDHRNVFDLLRVDEEIKLLFRNDDVSSAGADSTSSQAFAPREDDVDPGLYFDAGIDLNKVMEELQGEMYQGMQNDSATNREQQNEPHTDTWIDATGSPDRQQVANLGGTGSEGEKTKSVQTRGTTGSSSIGEQGLDAIPEETAM